MERVYCICLIIGILLPLLSLLFNTIDSAFDFIALEFFDVDFGDISICFLPLSTYSLCTASIVFGSLGLFLIDLDIVTRHIISGICAYVMAVLIQSLIKFLKEHTVEAEMNDLISERDCFVVNKIPANGYGAIVCKTEGKSDKTFTAKSKDGVEIEQDTEVVIYELSDSIATVSPKFE